MRLIADLHVHSKYAMACSKKLELPAIAEWAEKKGIGLVGTADFTHPAWLRSLCESLEASPNEAGLYRLKTAPQTRFICTSEVACIYSRGGAVRRVHLLLFAPSLEVVGELNSALEKRGAKLASDGRPILGMDSEELLRRMLLIDPRCFMVPAHAWTPWFAIFGSKSGFDTIEECFGELTPHITAIETGMSSDPMMNWRLSMLDRITLISNSDAHSLPHLGREANVFEGETVTYEGIIGALQKRMYPETKTSLTLTGTIEFFPEEGRYHVDGHRVCDVRMEPAETKKHKGICPKCHRPLTIGVMNRVDELADRAVGVQPEGATPFKSIVPLEELVALSFGVGVHSKKVQAEYERIVAHTPEFEVLLYKSYDDLASYIPERIVESIRRVREGNVNITPGYDGVYGVVDLFGNTKREKQHALFDISL